MARLLEALLLIALFAGCNSGAVDSSTTTKSARRLEAAFSSADAKVKEQIARAAQALKEQKYDQAFLALEAAKSDRSMTPEQGLALQDSMHCVQRALSEAATRGDTNALLTIQMLRGSP